MEVQGFSSVQAPVRVEIRHGTSTAAPSAETNQPVRTDVPNPVRETSRSSEAVSLRKAQQGDAINTAEPTQSAFAETLFADVFPEPLPADLSAAERSQVYAQVFGGSEGIGPDQRSSAAKRLFLTTANLFKS